MLGNRVQSRLRHISTGNEAHRRRGGVRGAAQGGGLSLRGGLARTGSWRPVVRDGERPWLLRLRRGRSCGVRQLHAAHAWDERAVRRSVLRGPFLSGQAPSAVVMLPAPPAAWYR